MLFLSAAVFAYETDQLTNRSQDIADSTAVLNRQVNLAITKVASSWRGEPNRWKFVQGLYEEIGGPNWVDEIERYAMFSPYVERIDAPRWDGIYGDMPLWRSRVIYFTGVSKTIRLGGELVGTDKLGHFISQGRKFYRRYLEMGSEELAAKRSAYTERGIFGSLLAGAYSNADLVANYEGYRFFRSLFEDDVIPGKRSILRWQNGTWIMQRPFDWNDHVNEYWDEALNPSHYDALLYSTMMNRLVRYCPQYWSDPQSYVVENDDELRACYGHLGLRDNSQMRLDALCPIYAAEVDEAAISEMIYSTAECAASAEVCY
jgi:hypothetical protein